MPTVKLITWNIQWGCGLDGRVDLARIVHTARALADFDVLCVQEIADNFPKLQGNDDRDQFAELASLLPGYACVKGYGTDVAGDNGRRRRFGNAIFSRYGVISARRHALPWPADAGKESMPRVAVEAVVQAPMGPIRVTTTHLEYYSDIQRRAQAQRLRSLHDEACHRVLSPGHPTAEGGPFDVTPQSTRAILTGDFNFPTEHPAYSEIQQALNPGVPRYRDAWPQVHGHRPHAPTFCVFDKRYSKTPYCCDFIFLSDDLLSRARSIAVDGATQASDHQPVLLELDDR
jgi:endonuclease/exonuclease/phosphatase family metal-dependent hydrolase